MRVSIGAGMFGMTYIYLFYKYIKDDTFIHLQDTTYAPTGR